MRRHTVPALPEPMSVERYMARAYPAANAAMLRRAIKQRDIRVNGARASGETLVRAGDELAVYISDEYLLGPLDVLYSDADLAIIVKPHGVSVDRDADGVGEDTIISRASARFGEAYLVNRLDHNTGGLMPIALNEATKTELDAAFESHSVRKFYECLTCGAPDSDSATLTHYGSKSADSALLRVYDAPRPGLVTLRLRYTVKSRAEVARLEIELLTGRTHQIRAQLAHVGHPVLGDDKYGSRELNRRYRQSRQQLWCTRLTIPGRGEWTLPFDPFQSDR